MLNLNVYRAGRLQDLLSLLEQADGLTVAELRAAIAEHIRTVARDSVRLPDRRPQAGKRRHKQQTGILCGRDGCGGRMALHLVNVSRCTNVGGNWRTQAVCTRCGCEQYSELEPGEIMQRGVIA